MTQFEHIDQLPDPSLYQNNWQEWVNQISLYLERSANRQNTYYDNTGRIVLDPEGNVAVDTPNLVDEAVSVIGSSFTAASETMNVAYSDLEEITVESEGEPVLIWMSATSRNASGANNRHRVRVTRGGVSQNEWGFLTITTGMNKVVHSYIYVDEPAEGTHTYIMQGRKESASANEYMEDRGMIVVPLKK